jgi:hypothetical protein
MQKYGESFLVQNKKCHKDAIYSPKEISKNYENQIRIKLAVSIFYELADNAEDSSEIEISEIEQNVREVCGEVKEVVIKEEIEKLKSNPSKYWLSILVDNKRSKSHFGKALPFLELMVEELFRKENEKVIKIQIK